MKRLSIAILLVFILTAFDFAFYRLVVKRYVNQSSAEMQAKSIELHKFLPFEQSSQIVRVSSSLKLSGDLPIIDGAAALYPVFSAFVAASYPKQSVEFDGRNFTNASRLKFSNTRGAYKAISDGEADLIFVVAPSKQQLDYAREKGANLRFVPIGLEAFVFIVNTNNKVSNLTVDQVRGIYSGQYSDWSQLGGERMRIDAVQRNAGSGSQSAFLKFMGETQPKRKITGFFGSAIGFSFRYYVEGIVQNGGVKTLSLNGAYPNKENISSRKYPLVAEIYAVYDENNKNENIRILIDWILSPQGQSIIENSGYVPIKG
nr:substrate-binding domain-containing protein [uncultured Campylobacter sp.]